MRKPSLTISAIAFSVVILSFTLAFVGINETAIDWQAYLPDESTFITLAVIAALCVGLWLVWSNLKGKTLGNDLPRVVVLGTGIAGILLASASLFLSTSFGWNMGGNHAFLPYVFALVFLAISIAEFVSTYWLGHFLQRVNATFFLIACVLMIVGVGTSILAGQALVASQVDQQKQARLYASDAYQSAQQQRENAHNRVAQLAVNEQAYHSAQSEIDTALSNAQSLISGNSVYSDCSQFPSALCNPIANYFSKTRELNAQLKPLQDSIKSNQAIIAQYQDFIAAKELANELNAEPLPQAVKNANLPHIIWLSDLTGVAPNIIEAKLYVSLAVISEFCALVLLFFYGLALRQDSPQYKPAKVTLNEPVPAMRVGGYVHDDGIAELHAGEIVLTAQQAKEWLAMQPTNSQPTNSQPASDQSASYSQPTNSQSASDQPTNSQPTNSQSVIVEKIVFQGIERVPSDKSQIKAKGRTGLIDSCIKCGDDYQVKVAHQLNCPKCSHEIKTNFAMKRK
jgi:hypothetical protein